MRIGIDIRSVLKKQKTGIGYYTLNIINSLARLDGQNRYFLYSRKRLFSSSKKLPLLPGVNFKHRVDYLGLGPGLTLRKACDVFHTSGFDLRPPKGAKFIVTVHDIIPFVFPQGHTTDAIERLKAQLPLALAAADRVIVDAQNTAADLIHFYPDIQKDKIRLVYPGAGDDFGVLAKDTKNLYKEMFLKYNIRSNYIIYIGTIEPRKNLKGLIKAYHSLKKAHEIIQQLVISGMKGWESEPVFRLVEELQLEKDVVFTGYVPRDHLKVFYNFADICVYPSFYEGAGLPVLEAFKCGCPVVTSNVSCMPEFAGEAAVLVNPHDIDSIAAGIWSILSSETLRSRLAGAGFKRAAAFTWENTARNMLNIFKEVAG